MVYAFGVRMFERESTVEKDIDLENTASFGPKPKPQTRKGQ
jgi:hypothetical protein